MLSLRLDIWLWAARFFKTRQLAKKAIEGGKIKVNDVPAKPAKLVHIGDCVKILREQELFDIKITALSSQRGSATVARILYAESDESRLRRELEAENRRMQYAGMQPPLRKPDRRARRLILALGDIDAM